MILLLLTLLAVSKPVTPAAQPELKTPLVMTIRQSVGMAPLTLRVKARAEAEGREVCVVVDGPEYQRACRTLSGVTWTQDFVLRASGCYSVFAISEQYRTPEVTVKVIGQSEQECS
jgi:hypothetical protein